ncbi:glycosyltransferase family 2 protein [Pseudomonas taiwanensis]|uniref:glycosyltransferase family 2 protein n=1 Tax=Pseudomonas taiwanensis TaxID=470150 RepID=UPI0015BE8B58|nr:glycosyltransferase family 2 protein [Pseudomonas taiwanensis]NWL80739.1 glycosyltransferase family 2 protein [Pseudomonas taiwanensis]
MSAKPLLSVVIPTYNYAGVLPRAVESVLAQATPEVELWVVDDGSTDDTPAVFTALSQRYGAAFQGVRQANAGPSTARNNGVQLAQGRYVLLLDADDELAAGVLPGLCERLRRQPDVGLWLAGHIAVQPDGREREHPASTVPAEPAQRLKHYLLDKKIGLSHGACVFLRELLLERPYPEHLRHSEDIPVFAYCLTQRQVEVLDLMLARIHKHPGSLRHNAEAARKVGLDLVDEVFLKLPAGLQSLKPAYRAQRCLSLFRTCLLAGDQDRARKYYREALRTDWRVLLKWSYTRKAARLWLR